MAGLNSNTNTIPNTVTESAHYHPNLYQKLRSDLLFSCFYKFFDVVQADTPELVETAHRLRFQVFCKEYTGFEDPAAHPDGLETDQYDDHSEHALLVYKPLNKAIGTVRAICPNYKDLENSFPMQKLITSLALHDETYIKSGCEISRLCISRKYRQEIQSDLKSRMSESMRHMNVVDPLLSQIALKAMPLGLIRGMFEAVMKKNMLNCYAVMEHHQLNKLIGVGLVHKTLGPDVDYHGVRTPFMFNILEVFDHIVVNNPDTWNLVSMKGINHSLAEMVQATRLAAASAT